MRVYGSNYYGIKLVYSESRQIGTAYSSGLFCGILMVAKVVVAVAVSGFGRSFWAAQAPGSDVPADGRTGGLLSCADEEKCDVFSVLTATMMGS